MDRKAHAPFFSLATVLLPATAALGAFMTWADPDSFSRFSYLQVLSIALPLLAFLAGRKAHARRERWPKVRSVRWYLSSSV